MNLESQRQAIRLLLDEQNPGDAMAAYYAFHHGEPRTHLLIEPEDAPPGKARGYVAISRTGMDLFRPLLTMRLPLQAVNLSAQLLKKALPAGAEAFVSCPVAYRPLVEAFYTIVKEEELAIYLLNKNRFSPTINVLVTREDAYNLPRYVIKQQQSGERLTAAAAGLNWQSPYFAEIAVRTAAGHRRQGHGISVVSALAHHILDSGRRPLYAVSPGNSASVTLARQLGFEDTGYRQWMVEVRKR